MTCHFLDGQVANILWPCDNSTSGPSTCCPAGAICYSNGVCYVEKGGVEDFLRAGCTDPSWDDPACLKQCLDFSPEKVIGIRPCDGITGGTDYCCDDGSEGRGSFHCCDTSSSLFPIGTAAPTILATMPISWTSTSAASTASSDDTTATGDTHTPSPEGGSSSDLRIGLGVGLGVGLPVAALLIGAMIFCARRLNKSATGATTAVQAPDPNYSAPQAPQGSGPGTPLNPSELHGGQRSKYELP